MANQFVVTAYFIYLPIVLVLTWYVAYTLFKNGLVFMRDIFNGREEIAVVYATSGVGVCVGLYKNSQGVWVNAKMCAQSVLNGCFIRVNGVHLLRFLRFLMFRLRLRRGARFCRWFGDRFFNDVNRGWFDFFNGRCCRAAGR